MSIRWIGWAIGGLLGTAILLHFALAGLQFGFKNETEREDRKFGGRVAEPAIAATRAHFPDPTLQITPRADLRDFQAREQAKLDSYGWIDKTGGVVRIPIERAMDLLAQRGLPVRGSNDTPRHISDLELLRKRMDEK